MKKIWLSIVLLLTVHTLAFSQDLISNALAGSSYANPVRTSPKVNALNIINRRAGASWSTLSLLTFQDNQPTPTLAPLVSGAVFSFELDQEQLFTTLTQVPRNIHFTIPLTADGSRAIELDLTQMRVVAEDFKIRLPSGETVIAGPTGVFYWGMVADDPHSLAVLSLFGDEVRLFIRDRTSTYILGKLQDDSGQYVLYDERQLIAEEPEWNDRTDINVVGPNTSDIPSGCLQVYAEVEFELFRDLDLNFINVGNYVLGLFAELTATYRNMGLNVQLSELVVWRIPDPYGTEYTNLDSTGAVLDTFIVNTPTFKGDVGHLLTTREIGGGRAAGIGGICQSGGSTGPYCVTGNLMTDFSEVLPNTSINFEQAACIMAHLLGARQARDIGLELKLEGHNLGAVSNKTIVIDDSCLDLDECAPDESRGLVVEGNPIPNDTYQSQTTVTSTGKATNSNPQSVVFQAGQRVVLEEGFEATEGFFAEVSTDFCGFENITSISLIDGVAGAPTTLIPATFTQSGSLMEVMLDQATDLITITFQVPAEDISILRVINANDEAVLILPPLLLDESTILQTEIDVANWPAGNYSVVLENEMNLEPLDVVKQ